MKTWSRSNRSCRPKTPTHPPTDRHPSRAKNPCPSETWRGFSHPSAPPDITPGGATNKHCSPMKIAVICIWIGCLFPLVSSGQSEWVIRRDALKVTPLTEIAIEEKWDTIYRLWDIPASEHLRRAPIIVFTLKYRGPISHEEYEGVVSIRVGLPDGTVLSRSQEASSKSWCFTRAVTISRDIIERLRITERFRDQPRRDQLQIRYRRLIGASVRS